MQLTITLSFQTAEEAELDTKTDSKQRFSSISHYKKPTFFQYQETLLNFSNAVLRVATLLLLLLDNDPGGGGTWLHFC